MVSWFGVLVFLSKATGVHISPDEMHTKCSLHERERDK